MKTGFSSLSSMAMKGFSLVEVAMAVSIAGVSIISLFALLPSGLDMFRESMNVTVSSQIAERLIQEAVQTDYDSLMKDQDGNAITGPLPFSKGWRYFDDQGIELTAVANSVYRAHTRVVPATVLPSAVPNANTSLATVTVQVVVNPSHGNIVLDAAKMVDPSTRLPYRTYNGHIAKLR